jgi:hypothetical protein
MSRSGHTSPRFADSRTGAADIFCLNCHVCLFFRCDESVGASRLLRNCTLGLNNPFSNARIIGWGKQPISLALTRGIRLEQTDGEIAMTSKTKSVLAAVLIAAFATPALAQGAAPLYYQAKQSRTVIEGRNSADFGTFNGTSTDRNSMVQTLGN